MQICFPLPDKQFVAEPIENVTEKVRLYAALGMYRAGELSIGAACELAGVDRYVFLEFCKHERVPIQTQTPDELEEDVHKLITGNHECS
jgi:predicted HTH domain antitoxin